MTQSFGIHFIRNITSQITLYIFNRKQSVISGTKKKMEEHASSIFLYLYPQILEFRVEKTNKKMQMHIIKIMTWPSNNYPDVNLDKSSYH
jgi:hypothetical protein